MDYSPWFDFWESKNVSEKEYHWKEHLKQEQNSANFSFVAPSSQEL